MTPTETRELLTLAAKAAGIEVAFHEGRCYNVTGSDPLRNIFSCPLWNPLADDGDALRLAVKLVIDLDQYVDSIRCIKSADLDGAEDIEEVWEDFGADQYAATRRAIVRAAAEIGKGMATDTITRLIQAADGGSAGTEG